ncbi:hypothetical protein K474DRAFT_1678587 [Panus rudis PR-1116 ss-1]|nr:hypothetical protein K474DRAFT_1678587 [Panus rudis PR-1116 ss-1]
MAPTTGKVKSTGVSTSTFFDLRAEIAKHEEEFAKNKAAGKNAIVGGVKRPDKKPTVWARQNKGVEGRANRDIELEAVDRPTLERARAVLERKAHVYEKLRKGKSGGLSEKQYETLLVDFDSKPIDSYESDSDDVDESLTVPKPPNDEDDPIIEYEDEFGRVRTGRKSEIPRHLLPPDSNEEPPEDDIDPFVIYNPVNHFPTYQPSEERVAEIEAELAEANNPLNIHYDASREVRAKGAAFYQFSADEETRRKQMEELRKAREETEKMRGELGAVNVKPGEVEGMGVNVGEEEKGGAFKGSRAMEKRKREIEERRKMLEAKRRKKNPEVATEKTTATTRDVASSEPSIGPPTPPPSSIPVSQAPADPFAALEAQAMTSKGKGKAKQPTNTSMPEDVADAFLAALERDMLKSSR